MNLKEWAGKVWGQNQEKPVMVDYNTPEFVAKLLQDEAQELTDSIRNDEEAFGVGSEIADVLYLALYLCHDLGFDPEDLLVMKLERNALKYHKDFFQDGNYLERVKEIKLRWEEQGGDKKFSEDYLG